MTADAPPGRAEIVTKAVHEPQRAVAVPGGTAFVFSARSPVKESDNEDSAAVIPIDGRRTVIAVADGVGGQPQGEAASQLSLEILVSTLEGVNPNIESLRPAILDALEQASSEIQALGVGAGTTIAIAEIDGDIVRPYHVGDSMILLVGQRGKVRHITSPHSPVGYAVKAGMICPVAAMHHHERHLVSNLLGISQMWIDVGSPVRMQPRDTLLLASDGLFDNLHEDEIIELVRKGSAEEAVGRLAESARRRMLQPGSSEPSKPDDLTFLLYRRTVAPSGSAARRRRRHAARDAKTNAEAH